MSMLDSFFKQRFNAAKCKTLLKLTIPRIKLLRNRREIQIKQMRKDIAKLLETGQEATARIRVEHIIREEKMMAAQEIVELFCELIAVRLPIIEAQRECPLDLKEAISSVCFAAPRCADLPELLQVQMLFAGKYGKEFVSAATELMPECGVNRQLVELLSIRAPAPDVKLKLLKEIAEEHELDWDPSATESELLKPHEDLLFVTGSKVPLLEEKLHETACTTSEAAYHENTDSGEVDSDILDFPEVPKQLVKPNKVTVSAPEMLHFPASVLSETDDQEESHPSGGNNNTSHLESEEKIAEDKQFVPFISPPLQSSASFPKRAHNSPPSSSISSSKYDNKVDLQDVLDAAQAAAETAELAAAAARSAASIAQLRINELVKKNNDDVLGPSVENQFHLHKPMSDMVEKTDLDKHSIVNSGSASSTQSDSSGKYATHHSTPHPLMGVDPFPTGSIVVGASTGHHQPQRLPFTDDETYFSYPNLFTSQGSNFSTHEQSFTD